MTGTSPLGVALLIGSTRDGRAGGAIGDWFAGVARRRGDVELDVVDLAAFDFPAGYPAEPTAAMSAFTGRIERAEAFVVVTPEYNRSFPASLKQAIDYAYDEWQAKPVGFVSYGCRMSGMYAVEALRTVFTELHMVTVRDSLGFDLLDGEFGDDGTPHDTDSRLRAAASLLDQLVWWGLALRDARAARPYVS
ncbi:NADPH-dependent FMN reductase [Amycolatopsis antarctica]|uniref:NADPH-dependent FMN reductase n=1 Tax=Amycolatopsis antarctica TaxID=1854586 RepID=A0A263DAB6_9PSEU|nr:NAD(P)H-dependent oxidoreductase [Amycolatopsis antarctica]OZM75301.1 NADPH-dependent FMN reductase [Amycolatopsis antarctica]